MFRVIHWVAVAATFTVAVGFSAAGAHAYPPLLPLAAAPSTVEPGGTIQLSGPDGCPDSTPILTLRAYISDSDDAAGTWNHVGVLDSHDITPGDGGAWQVALHVPEDLPVGHHVRASAICAYCDSAGECHTTASFREVIVPVVAPQPTVPDPVDDSLSTRQDSALPIVATQLLANDPRGGGWICQVGQAGHGRVGPGGGSGEWTYTPARGFHGSDSFTYRLCQVSGGHDVASNRAATVRITVAAAGPGPRPGDDPTSAGSGDPADPGIGNPGVGDPGLGHPGAGSSTPGSGSPGSSDSGTPGGDPTGSSIGTGPTSPAIPSLTLAAAPNRHHDDNDTLGIVIVGIAAALVCAIAAWGTWYWRRTRQPGRAA